MRTCLGDETDAWRHHYTGPTEKRHGEKNRCPSSSLQVELKLGWDEADRQSVTLKTFRTDLSAPRACSRNHLVRYEAKSMSRVTPHRNVVHLLKVEVASPLHVCLIMEAAAASRGNLAETIAAAPGGR